MTARVVSLRRRERLEGRYSSSREPAFRQVLPGGIPCLYQMYSTRPGPLLYPLLTGNRIADVREFLEVHEARDAVSARKSGITTQFVLTDTPGEIVSNPRIEHAGAACHDVDVVNTHS